MFDRLLAGATRLDCPNQFDDSDLRDAIPHPGNRDVSSNTLIISSTEIIVAIARFVQPCTETEDEAAKDENCQKGNVRALSSRKGTCSVSIMLLGCCERRRPIDVRGTPRQTRHLVSILDSLAGVSSMLRIE